MGDRITIGAFTLVEQIGAGGMGTIWRGRHESDDEDVALKFVTAAQRDLATYQAGFRREVEAVAGLAHPGIVGVYDYGEVGELAARASAGALLSGTPWLAMELASFGNLQQIVIESWAELRVVLHDVLDALAHAHSRGIVHRDLKPANILVTETAQGELLLKLSDFGIAQLARDRREGADEVAGTPTYMAPEQFTGRTLEHGPWTDLYALGAMAFECATGEPPFGGDGFFSLARAHLSAPVPTLRARFDVPEELAGWIERLLSKAPRDRFQHAADARFSLQRFDPLEGEVPVRMRLEDVPQREFSMRAGWASARTLPLVSGGDDDAVFDGPEPTESFRVTAPRVRSEDRPPIPATWAAADDAARVRALLSGVGLGLFGLRPIPFVGRERERDVLWQTLRAVERDSRSRVVVVAGEPGCGKSRLAEWFAQRANELGAATVLGAAHDSMASDEEPLRQMIARTLRLQNVEPRVAFERLRADHGPDEAAALTALVARGAMDPGVPQVEFASDQERYLTADIALRAAAAERPVIVWLDDVQWGADVLAWVLSFLDRAANLPVMFVCTLRSEATFERDREAQLLQTLEARPEATRIELDPLDDASRRLQIQRMLRLPDDIVERVAVRSEGNPLFAVQLVGDWVQRGLLVRGERGFELRAGDVALPDDIHGLWLQRVADLETRFGPPARDALRAAAAIGDEVAEQTWRLVCEAVGVEIPGGLMQALVTRRLAARIDHGLRFVHRMLRESLERDARDAGVWARYNGACAAIMELEHPRRTAAQHTRTALYLLQAKADHDAIDQLILAAEMYFDREDLGDAENVVEIAERAVAAADLPAHDERRGLVHKIRWELHRHRGQFAESDAMAAALLDEARANGWRRVEASALFDMGSTTALYDNAVVGRELLLRAVEMFDDASRERRRAAALRHLSHVYALRGNADLSAQCARDAFRLYTGFRDPAGKAWCLYYLGLARRIAGEAEDAVRRLEDALEQAETAGLRDLQANCHNVLADLARMQGEFERAAIGYARAEQIWRSIGSTNVAAARLNVAISALQRSQFSEARALLETLCVEFERHSQRIPLAAAQVALVACAAHDDDPLAALLHVERAKSLLRETGLVDPDVVAALEIAITWFEDRGRAELAGMAGELLEAQRIAMS